jgi:hypothetical protein
VARIKICGFFLTLSRNRDILQNMSERRKLNDLLKELDSLILDNSFYKDKEASTELLIEILQGLSLTEDFNEVFKELSVDFYRTSIATLITALHSALYSDNEYQEPENTTQA